MRFLKLKIARAALCKNSANGGLTYGHPAKAEKVKQPSPVKSQPKREAHKAPAVKIEDGKSSPSQYKRSKGNNIMKNYCQAMISFALSPLADFYLLRENESRELGLEHFRQMLSAQKTKINCIKSLREVLLVEKSDSKEIQAFKKLFQVACKIFIKYFSVNWIYNGKLTDRVRYLEYRGKILRRIQDPEHFTFLKSFVEKKPKSNKKRF